jgi:hypothetical protein
MPKLVREATRRGMREIHDAFWANRRDLGHRSAAGLGLTARPAGERRPRLSAIVSLERPFGGLLLRLRDA